MVEVYEKSSRMYPRQFGEREVITRRGTTSLGISSFFSPISTVWNEAWGSRLEHSAHRNYISHFLSPFFTWVNVRAVRRKAIPPAPTRSSSSTTFAPSSSSLLRLSFRVPTTISSTAEAKDMKAAAAAGNSKNASSPRFPQPQQPSLDSISFLQQLHHDHHHHRLVKNSRSSSSGSSLFTPLSPSAFHLQHAAPSARRFSLFVLDLTPHAPHHRRSVAQEQDGRGQRQS